jgi:VanZ family protein
MRGRRWFLIALPVYWCALAALTHYPRVRIPGEIPSSDKIVHFTAFGLLAFLFWQFRVARDTPLRAGFVWIAGCVLVAYATVDEFTQDLVGRYSDIVDWGANVAGILCTLAVLELRRRRATERS